jgi:hypothetical protein
MSYSASAVLDSSAGCAEPVLVVEDGSQVTTGAGVALVEERLKVTDVVARLAHGCGS